MRSDYALYAVGIILVIIATSFVLAYNLLASSPTQSLWVMGASVLGLFSFMILGYTQRPRTRIQTVEAPPMTSPTATLHQETSQQASVYNKVEAPIAVSSQPAMPEPIVEKADAHVTPTDNSAMSPTIELTAVKGIKEKRAEQLKMLGINSIEELAKASPKNLAQKLKISPKFTENWIENAKELTKR